MAVLQALLLLCVGVSQVNAQALFQQHACGNLISRLNKVSSACGTSPAQCTADCAGELVPLTQDSSCESMLNAVADVSGADSVRDGKATAVFAFADKCTRQLKANITALRARGCSVDTSEIEAVPVPSDNKSAAAVPVGTRRNMFGNVDTTDSRTCPRASFNTKLAELRTRCCAKKGNCAGGLPKNCSFDCAQFYTGFFRNCSSFIKSVDARNYAGYAAFAKTCGRLPAAAMVKAVKGATCAGV